jgi:hypothetical protein
MLWSFAHEMWEHQNSLLDNTKIEVSYLIHDAEINDAITRLYGKMDIYTAEA